MSAEGSDLVPGAGDEKDMALLDEGLSPQEGESGVELEVELAPERENSLGEGEGGGGEVWDEYHIGVSGH